MTNHQYNGQRSAVSGQRSAVSGESDSSHKVVSFRDFCKFCKNIISNFNFTNDLHKYFSAHSLRLYNTVKFVAKVTGMKTGLTLLAPGGGPAFVEAYLSKFMGFHCTIIDMPHVVAQYKDYYDWAGFDSIGMDIDEYVQSESRTFDVVMSLENIEHIHAAPAEYIAKFKGSLALEGYFIISTPNYGSIAHLLRIAMMMPTLPVPERTFDLNSHCHYREYMPCEIIDAYEQNGLKYLTRAYTNESTAFKKYDTSRRALHHVKNSAVKFLMHWLIPCLMSFTGIVPRFRYIMILAAQKLKP